jgi:hypothetical protein
MVAFVRSAITWLSGRPGAGRGRHRRPHPYCTRVWEAGRPALRRLAVGAAARVPRPAVVLDGEALPLVRPYVLTREEWARRRAEGTSGVVMRAA